jgi:hypothetical protein
MPTAAWVDASHELRVTHGGRRSGSNIGLGIVLARFRRDLRASTKLSVSSSESDDGGVAFSGGIDSNSPPLAGVPLRSNRGCAASERRAGSAGRQQQPTRPRTRRVCRSRRPTGQELDSNCTLGEEKGEERGEERPRLGRAANRPPARPLRRGPPVSPAGPFAIAPAASAPPRTWRRCRPQSGHAR